MNPSEATLIRDVAAFMRTPRLRSLAEFAEQEIIVPDGPFAGRRFRLDRHPVARLLFAELGSGKWRRAFITGPNQDGKSFLGFVIPLLYLLFERRETVVFGVPTLDMWRDKWRKDLAPVIKASRYEKLLPRSGGGSKEGDSVLLSFGNGVHLRCMTGGGDDQSRAAFTSPNLVVTETDGFDEIGSTSREGDKFSQLERRTLAFADRARTIAECTVSTEQGRTWQEIQHGTASRIALPCPHCRAWVTPEREHFVGWQDADTEVEAIGKARLVCPACGVEWTNAQRIEANHAAVLVHKGQDVAADGTVVGAPPLTRTLGFRWTVANSVLNPDRLSLVGGIEWKARRAADEEAAERDVSQSQWALPSKPAKVDLSQLDAFAVMRRTLRGCGKGVCPDKTEFVTVAIDVGKWKCHWAAIAWRAGATPHVIEYDTAECPSEDLSEEVAILTALREWRDEVASQGWRLADGGAAKPVLVLVDARYKPDAAFRFIEESGDGYFATMGFGTTQKRQGSYKRDTGSRVIATGEHYNLIERADGRRYLEVNSDEWKSHLHARLNTPVDKPGALTLFDAAAPTEHLKFSRHLTSEKKIEVFEAGVGTVTRWEAMSRNTHWLDASMLNCVAAHVAGTRVVDAPPAPPPPPLPAVGRPERPDWMPDRPTGWTSR